ncbi:GGDEF domain-containing protein [Deinococcus cellulosilyticus]|nr:sensor domain-containing diguanylate cyclase [Deinococcus cellulosilyticus]
MTTQPEQVFRSLLKASGERSSRDFLQVLAHEMSTLFGAERVLIAESIDVSQNQVRLVAGFDGSQDLSDAALDLSGLPCAEVYTGQKVSHASRVNDTYPLAAGYQSYFGAPLLDAAGQLIGHYALYSSLPDQTWDTDLLTLLGRSIEAEVHRLLLEREQERLSQELTSLNEKLLQESILDPLTGLLNRQHFTQLLLGEFLRFKRYGESFGVLTIGVDEFRRINDRFGHDAGDMVIREVANNVQQEIRHGVDMTARLSGEEFVVLAVHARLDSAAVLAERLRRRLSQLTYTMPEGTLKVTCSVGISVVSQDDTTWEQVLKRANVGLYEAKSRGRNQVVAWV